MILTLLKLEENKNAKVVKIEGGTGISKKLESLGLRTGVKIKKTGGASVFGGPVIVKSGQTNMAIGRGMANKIIVDTDL